MAKLRIRRRKGPDADHFGKTTHKRCHRCREARRIIEELLEGSDCVSPAMVKRVESWLNRK